MKQNIFKRLLAGIALSTLACAPLALQPQPSEYEVLRSSLPRVMRDLMIEADSYTMTTIMIPETDLLNFEITSSMIACLNENGDPLRTITWSGESEPLYTDYTYNENGKVIRENQMSSYYNKENITEYDAMQRPVREVSVSYSEDGTERSRHESIYSYDASGTGVAEVWSDGVVNQRSELDVDGQVIATEITVKDITMRARYIYDEYGTMVRSEVEDDEGQLRINENKPVYDALGNTISSEVWRDGELQGVAENLYVDGVLRETIETDTSGNVYRTLYQDIIG